jgi:hypothetical protein
MIRRAALYALALAGCSGGRSTVEVTVTASHAITAPTVQVGLAWQGRTAQVEVPNAGGAIPPELAFSLTFDPDVQGTVQMTFDALVGQVSVASASTAVDVEPGRVASVQVLLDGAQGGDGGGDGRDGGGSPDAARFWTPEGTNTQSWLGPIWGSGQGDVWVIEQGPLLLHLSAGMWTVHTINVNDTMSGVWGSDATHLWVVSDLGIYRSVDGGTTWTMTSTTGGRAGWAASPTEAWVVGNNGLIQHTTDGAAWKPVISPTSQHLTGVWGSGPSDVWMVGNVGTILHCSDGVTVQAVMSNLPTSPDLISPWGTGASDVWAAGTGGTIVHWNGTTWTAQQASSDGRAFFALIEFSPSDVYASGENGIVVHYDGMIWTELPSPRPGRRLYGIWGTSGNDLYVAGETDMTDPTDTLFHHP